MTTLILTVLGDDEPGLVSAISAPISAHGGSWGRSQMAHLEGKFAGLVMVQVPGASADALVADLTALREQGLQVSVERAADRPERPSQRLELELLGSDHPGIVAEISACLADSDVSIEDLSTDWREAPMAGGLLFEARAVLEAPSSVDTDALQARLEKLADALMVDIRLTSE